MAAVCGQTSVWPGANFPGIPTPHMAATHTLDEAATGSTRIDAHQAFLLCHALRAAKATIDSLIPA